MRALVYVSQLGGSTFARNNNIDNNTQRGVM